MSSSKPSVIVRLAGVADADGIARAHVLAWQVAYRGLVEDRVLDGLSIERRAAFWSDIIAKPRNPKQRTWVAEIDGRVVGFVTSGPSRDSDGAGRGELQAIYVLPEQWNAGAGHALHEACVDALHNDGFADATLWVVEGNARALQFYARHGWAPDGKSKVEEWDGATMSEIRLRRPL